MNVYEFLQVVDNIHMKGTMSQIIDIGSRFDFITKKGNLLLFFSWHLFFIS